MNDFIGYCRISTKSQQGNYSLEQQEKEILSRYPQAKIYKEQYTGSKIDRPIFQKVINELQPGSTLIVTKLDRLARNTIEGIETVQSLFNKDVSVHVLNVGLLENNSMGKFFLTVLLAIAEMERNTIIERTAAGREVARTKEGYKEGRPIKHSEKQRKHALHLLKSHSYSEVEQITGISRSTLQRIRKAAEAGEL